jgi:AcrR family transcriptional regulator
VAGRLFRQHGFDGVGVDDLMKAAGFTHGGFYNHFASRTELVAEASAAGTAQAKAALVESLSVPRSDAWERFVHDYLSAEHRGDPAGGCTLWPPPIPPSPTRFSPRTAAGSAERPAQQVRDPHDSGPIRIIRPPG